MRGLWGGGGVSKRRRGSVGNVGVGGGCSVEVGAGGATSCSMYAASLLGGVAVELEDWDSEDANRYFRPRTAMETDLAAQCLARAVRRRRPGRTETPAPRASAPLHYARLDVVCSPDELDADLGAMRACGTAGAGAVAEVRASGAEARTGLSAAAVAAAEVRTRMDVDSLFVRCVDSKGWVRCVACGEVQWPPNREKHLAKCTGLLGHIHSHSAEVAVVEAKV